MTDREIRYCTTSDGVRIAYCVEGEGPPLLVMQFFVEAFSLDHKVPEQVAFMEKLRRGRRIIRYDQRGTGLSARESYEIDPDSAMLDLEAVASAIGGPPFTLLCSGVSGTTGIRFAVRQSERVERLVLFGTLANIYEAFPEDVLRGFAELARTNWALAARLFGDLSTRQSDAAAGLRWGEVYRDSSSGEHIAQALSVLWIDANPDLPHVSVPTLVLHKRNDAGYPFEAAQRMAAKIPGATFVPLEGIISHYAHDDPETTLKAFNAFIPADSYDASATVTTPSGAFRTVLFTDLVGHTEMMSRLGDGRGRDVLREDERITREVLKANGGTEVKTMGDGFMASFGSVAKAVECAIALQRAFADREGEPLSVRVGLNAGEPIEEDGDLFGATVILASRSESRRRRDTGGGHRARPLLRQGLPLRRPRRVRGEGVRRGGAGV
jgi:pimeloyl-ACP methyl ester carboxylesterase